MERPVLVAETREGLKKGNARKLRAKGLIPAVFYGPRTKTLPLVLDPKELSRTLQTEAGANVLIDLDIRNADQLGRKVVMVKDIQIDPLQRAILHADFYEVAMDEMVTVEIPIHLVGKSEGVKAGGILEQVRRVIEIQCLPGDIPKFIDVDVTALNDRRFDSRPGYSDRESEDSGGYQLHDCHGCSTCSRGEEGGRRRGCRSGCRRRGEGRDKEEGKGEGRRGK